MCVIEGKTSWLAWIIIIIKPRLIIKMFNKNYIFLLVKINFGNFRKAFQEKSSNASVVP